jgi:ferredoxin-NADP reductase
LPEDKDIPLVFISGGIGVTPFRSIVWQMMKNGERRDVVHLYANRTEEDVAFKKLFEKAENVGVKTVFINTEKDGHIDEKMIRKYVPNYKERIFYVSGPKPMVEAFEKMLKEMGIKKIKIDDFPGYTMEHQR